MNKAKAQFYRMLQSLAKAGLPMLRILAQPAPRKLKKTVARLRQAVEGGMPLEEAMRREPVFTPFEISLVAVGAASGTLENNFGALADWFETRHAITMQIVSGLVHPAATYFLAAPLLAVVDIFMGKMPLPLAATRIVLWWIAPFVIIWLYRRLSPILNKSELYCAIMDAVPIIGSLRHKQESAIFFQAFGLCLQGGLGAVAAVRLSADACRYGHTRKKFHKMADIIERDGETFTNSFQKVMSSRDEASPAPGMIATGEASGSLADYALRLSSLAQQESKTLLTRLAAATPIIAFIPLALYIGYRVISFYTGLYSGTFLDNL
ncbi:MAG: type II secretion system F family protein [Victivallales bacterium]|nr:type II secretion system F family protein [Victivallales bacterium]